MKYRGRFLKRPVTKERVLRLLQYIMRRIEEGRGDRLTCAAFEVLDRILK